MENLIKRILRERVSEKEIESGFQEFYTLLEKQYGKTPNFNEIVVELEKDIKNSPTPKITITDRGMFCGMSLNDNVILSKSIFSKSLFGFIFVLFHEIAHQYQYKKYGKNLLYDLTTGDINDEILTKLIKVEHVADRFGESMANKYSNKFDIPKSPISSPYSNVEMSKNSYKSLLLKIQDEIKNGNISCVEQMESFMLDTLTSKPYVSTYTGSSYNDYGSYYGRDYSPRYYDDEFYARNYEKYEKDELDDESKNIQELYQTVLEDLFHKIGSEINQIVDEAYDVYGATGHNLVIDMINEEGFTKFHHNQEEDEDSEENKDPELLDQIDEDFYPIVRDLKKYVEESLHKIMDDVEKNYGYEGNEIIIDLIDETGFGDLWLNY